MKRSFVRTVLTWGAWTLTLPMLLVGEPTVRIMEPTVVEPSASGVTVETQAMLDRIANRAARVAARAEALRTLVQDAGAASLSEQRASLSNIQRLANVMGVDLCRLHAVSGDMSPSQEMRFDEMTPDIVELADKTDAAIQFLGDNATGITASDYRAFVTEIEEDALRIQQIASSQNEPARISVIESENNYQIAVDYCGF